MSVLNERSEVNTDTFGVDKNKKGYQPFLFKT